MTDSNDPSKGSTDPWKKSGDAWDRSTNPWEQPVDPAPHVAAVGVPGAVAAQPGTVVDMVEPDEPGTSAKYTGGSKYRSYLFMYALASLGIFAIWGSMGGIILPNHVQLVEFGNFFTGADAGVDLAALQNLRAAVEAGTATPTAEEQRLLGLLAGFDAARAQGLATVTAVGVFVTMFIQPIVGVLSDRTRSPWGRRAPYIAGGAVIGALLLIALRYSSSIVLMAIFWALAQVVINCAQGPLTATVADRVVPEKVGSASAISGLGLMAGAVLGSVAAGMLFGAMGLDAYYPFAIALAAGAILFVLVCRDRSSTDLHNEPLNIGQFFLSFLIPLRDPDFRWVWIAKIVMMFGYTVGTAFAFYMLQGYIQPALSPEEATATAPLLSLAGFPFMLVAMVAAGRWSDRIMRRKPFVFWASIIAAASYLVPIFWPALPALFIQAIIGGAAMGTFLVVDQALFIDVIPDKRTAGRDLGMGALGGNLGQALGPIVGGWIVAWSGYQMVWIAAVAIVLVAAFAILPVKRAK
ncbi:MFS transporter [Propioniciclava soli]|uniref:MFS transporter n=1 Tax=Propioniciclava soli TaxID=2775081 RepID=A0ABZ3CAQ0_9ACTN